ncbi:mannose-6-phosphate isomerase, class I [Spirillospora sp. NPDC047279]|uniref:mannose-6-phosphate isomerase, class I n=1 Tax=Spirillospora sp. NPDC047279 TaxID=3155478 RepID=UPI0033E5A24C
MRLSTVVRPYPWGSSTAFPAMFGTEPTGEPQAELWVGAHPSAPSLADGRPLNELIGEDPAGLLGRPTADRFGPVLPYLLKVLAVEHPLSLQAHPSAEQAASGFAREEAAGIAPDDVRRSYKDPRHKPEMVCAVGDFQALCGFRDPRDAADLLDGLGVPETAPWRALLRDGALRDAFERILGADADADADARYAVERALLDSGREELAVYRDLAKSFPGDPGATAALLLNHVRLRPGEAMYLGAGVPHAYLSGVAVEIMANSDNVLRCGLTGKHRDVAEAVRVLDFRPAGPFRVAGSDRSGTASYRPPAGEFMLTRYDLAAGTTHPLTPGVPRVLLCLGGEAHVQGTAPRPGEARVRETTLRAGEAAFVPAAAPALGLTGRGTLYAAEPGEAP